MYKLETQFLDAAAAGKMLRDSEDRPGNIAVADNYLAQLEDLFLIRNPKFRFIPDRAVALRDFINQYRGNKEMHELGSWVYFEHAKTMAHYLPEAEHFEIRTARNKNLVNAAQQRLFYDRTIGIAGLSVGSHAALTIAISGGAKKIKLADPDVISASNLNRVRYGATKIGRNKARLAGELILEINPYAEIWIFDEGVTEQNQEQFFNGGAGLPKTDLLVEEVDNLAMKIRLRELAKINKIPVLMATDNGDNVIADIERYDIQPHLPIFNGAIGAITSKDFAALSPADIPKLATQIAGASLITPRMQDSLLQVGKTLYSWPQLATAATLSGAVIAYLARKILCGEKIVSGKYELNLDSIFEPEYHAAQNKNAREQNRSEFLKIIGLQ